MSAIILVLIINVILPVFVEACYKNKSLFFEMHLMLVIIRGME